MHELLNRIKPLFGRSLKDKVAAKIEKVEAELNESMRWRALISNPDNDWSIFVERVMTLLAEEAKVLREADVITDPAQQRRATQAQTIITTFSTLINEATNKAAKARAMQDAKQALETELFNIENN